MGSFNFILITVLPINTIFFLGVGGRYWVLQNNIYRFVEMKMFCHHWIIPWVNARHVGVVWAVRRALQTKYYYWNITSNERPEFLESFGPTFRRLTQVTLGALTVRLFELGVVFESEFVSGPHFQDGSL